MTVREAAQQVLHRNTDLEPGQQSRPALVARVISSGVQHLNDTERDQALEMLVDVTSPSALTALSANDRRGLLAALDVVSGHKFPHGSPALGFFGSQANVDTARQTASPADVDRWTEAMVQLSTPFAQRTPSMHDGNPQSVTYARVHGTGGTHVGRAY